MKEKKNFFDSVQEICKKDPRYKADAYEFLMQSLYFTQGKLKRPGHISGKELLEGIMQFVVDQYGPMARTVLTHWGINKTEDFGNIVFNLVEKKILSRTETDSIDDFKDGYDFDSIFSNLWKKDIIRDLG